MRHLSMPISGVGIGLALLLVGFFVTGCEDDPPPMRSGGRAPEPPAAAKPAGGTGAESAPNAELDVPEKLKTIDWNAKDDLDRDLRDTRDPFRLFVDDLRPRSEGAAAAAAENPCTGPLCAEEAASFRLVAIITGTAVHKAMLIDSNRMGHMVRAGDVVGRSPYRITRITRNEVVMKPLQPSLAGQPAVQEVVKRLVSQEELQELIP